MCIVYIKAVLCLIYLLKIKDINVANKNKKKRQKFFFFIFILIKEGKMRLITEMVVNVVDYYVENVFPKGFFGF